MSKRKKIFLSIASILVVILSVVGIYAYNVYNSLQDTVSVMHQPIEREVPAKRVEKLSLEKKDPFSVLLLGVDKREHDNGRSDTMVVLTVNPNEDSIKMISIPRDTRVPIVGKDFEDKINHAYAFGGVPMSVATVEDFLDIPIDYYIEINMEGFQEIVDAVGGVKVKNQFAFNSGGFTFQEGQIELTGKEALAYSRMRYEDPRGDLGRQQRQRQIIEAVIREGASLQSLWKYEDIFTALGNNVKTNLTFDEMVTFQSQYSSAVKNIDHYQVDGKGQRMNDIYYNVVSDEERARLQGIIKKHLGV